MISLTKMVTGLAAAGLAVGTLAAGGASAFAASGSDSSTGLAPLVGPDSGVGSSASDVVPNSYIVVLKDGAGSSAASSRATKAGGEVTKTYSHLLGGYAATLSGSELSAVRKDPAVKYVQPNQTIKASGAWEKNVDSWGLDRLDQRNRPVNKTYYYQSTGSGVTAFVVDTGVYAKHQDFQGRVLAGTSEVGSGDGRTDCNGHGTHVAGTIGGQYYGVAKAVKIVPVRVLNCKGEGTTADFVAGLDWIQQYSTSNRKLVNVSLGDDQGNQAMDDAVQQLIDNNIPVIVAAGNGDDIKGVNACTVSPASVPGAITVGASTSTDRAAAWSNFGPCVDIYAPGEKITSDVPGKMDGNFWIANYSGTSMAAPHVTGAAALYLQHHRSATPAELMAGLRGQASIDKIAGVSSSYHNDLLFTLEPVKQPTNLATGDRFLEDQALVRGDRLYSKNQAYFLALRSSDGWLCLYNAKSGKVVWSSAHSASWAYFQGFFSTYDNYGRSSWNANTVASRVDTALVVNNGGYLAQTRIKDGKVIWTTPH